jgi:hypothetical protein
MNPNADPTTAPAIVAFAEDCWRESVGDGFHDVNDDGACDVVIPARVALDADVEVDKVARKSIVENEVVDDDEVLSATHSESIIRECSYKGHVAIPCGSSILYQDVKVQLGGKH